MILEIMEKKEKIEELADYLSKLTKLTESIYEREIYPVSFFSQAYDITNKIREVLHQIEIVQVELFEHQVKEHQAQIHMVHHLEKKAEQTEEVKPTVEKESKPYAPVPSAEPEEKSIPSSEKAKEAKVANTVSTEKRQPTPDTVDKKNEQKILSDLTKAFTLNDRFRFCRELFSSNESLMNQTFSALNNVKSYDSSVVYVKEHFTWNLEDEVVVEFMDMLKKRFA